MAISLPCALFPIEEAQPYVVRAGRGQSDWLHSTHPVTVLTRQDIQAQAGQPLGRLLEGTPGSIYLVKGNGFAVGKSGVALRGWGMGSEVVVARDGLRLSNDTDGEGFDLSLLDLGALESVEVLRGASSSLYGSGAHAGVVNLVSRRPGSAPGYSLSVEGGSWGRQRSSFSAEGGQGSGQGWRVHAMEETRDDYWTPDHGTFPNSSFHRGLFSAMLDSDFEPWGWGRGEIGVFHGQGWNNGLPGDLFAPAPDDMDLRDSRSQIVARWKLGQLGLAAHFSSKARFNQRLGPRGPSRTVVDQEQRSSGAGLQALWRLERGGADWVFGADYLAEVHGGSGQIRLPTGATYSSPKLPPSQVDNAAAFVTHSYPFSPGFSFEAGGRADYFQHQLFASQDVLFEPGIASRSAFTAHGGLSYELAPGLAARVSGGNSYVSPNIIQLYTFNPRTGFALLGNPRLDPETGFSVDAGLNFRKGSWRAELTGFASEMSGRLEMALLLRDFAAGGNSFKDLDGAFSRPDLLAHPKLVNAPTNKWFYHRNLGLTQVQGLEAMLKGGLGAGFHASFSCSGITKMVETGTGRWLDSLSPFSARAELGWRGDGGELSLSGRHGSGYQTLSRTRPGSPSAFTPDFALLDAQAAWRAGGAGTLRVQAFNLLNAAWQQTLDVPEAGFEARASWELEI